MGIPSSMRVVLLVGAVWLWAHSAVAQGHQVHTEWATLTAELGAGVPLGTPFGPEWSVEPGLAIRGVSPAYGGDVRGSLLAFEADPQRDDLPGFLVLAMAVGWGPSLDLGPVHLGVGPELGVVHMRFEAEGGFTGPLKDETEVHVGVFGRAEVPLTKHMQVWADASVARIALAERVTLASLAAGVSVRIHTPGWLQDVLR
ncbi:MAG: hypothetical protein Rubg2KO_02370 [Rubricoccaceae bacterium]